MRGSHNDLLSLKKRMVIEASLDRLISRLKLIPWQLSPPLKS